MTGWRARHMETRRERNHWGTSWFWWNLPPTIGVGVAVVSLGFAFSAPQAGSNRDAVNLLSTPVDLFLFILLAPACTATWLLGSGVVAAASALRVRPVVVARAIVIATLAAVAWYAADYVQADAYRYVYLSLAVG